MVVFDVNLLGDMPGSGECVPDSEGDCEPECPSGEICVNGECVVDGDGCDPACGADEDCVNDECIPSPEPGPCQPPCGSDEICVNSSCVPDPGGCEPACETGEICVNDTCVPDGTGCNPACQPGESCVDDVCVPDGTGCNPECSSNEICVNGTCVPDDDSCDPECDADQDCVNGECVPKPCGDCQTCIEGVCEDDCMDCQVCEDDTCVDDCDGCKTCVSDVCEDDDNNCVSADCEICDDGTCTDECPGQSLVCNDATGQCVECMVDDDCIGNPSGDRCDTETNICVECLSDDDCDDCEFCDLDTNSCEDLIFTFSENTVYIAQKNASGSWFSETTPDPVARNTTVKLRPVLKGSLNKDNIEGYYWIHDEANVTGLGTVKKYPNCQSATIAWEKVMPLMAPSSGNRNDPWNTLYDWYTNVVESPGGTCECPHGVTYSNPGTLSPLGDPFGPNSNHANQNCPTYRGLQSRTFEGNGCGIVEYSHTSCGSGWEITADTEIGVTHYTVSVTIGGVTHETVGQREGTTVSHLVYDTQATDWAYNRGVKNVVTRLVRLSNPTSGHNFIKHIESYQKAPWIYGSWNWQAKDYIGFDCADLIQAAAYHLEDDSGPYEASANGLAGRPAIRQTGEPYRWVGSDSTVRDKDNKIVSIPIGSTGVPVGSLVMINWDGDADYDHTTVLYSHTGTLKGSSMLIFAGHDGSQSGVVKLSFAQELNKGDSATRFVFREGW